MQPETKGAGMKLILTASVDNLGAPGDVVEVKDGYGRNYPRAARVFAIRWTRGAEKQIDGIKRSRAAREIRGMDHAEEVRGQLEDLTIDLPARAGDTGKLFGAVTAGDVAAAIKKSGGPFDRQARRANQPSRSRPSVCTPSASSCTMQSPPTYGSSSSEAS